MPRPIRMKSTTHVIRNADGDRAQSWHVKELLGLSMTQHLPAEGMPEQVIQGFRVFVRPLNPKTSRRRVHRVRAICPVCGKEVSAGRLVQHMPIHDPVTA